MNTFGCRSFVLRAFVRVRRNTAAAETRGGGGEEEEGEEEEALLFPSARELVERTSAETVVPLVACVSGM